MIESQFPIWTSSLLHSPSTHFPMTIEIVSYLNESLSDTNFPFHYVECHVWLLVKRKIECNYVLGGPYLSFLISFGVIRYLSGGLYLPFLLVSFNRFVFLSCYFVSLLYLIKMSMSTLILKKREKNLKI